MYCTYIKIHGVRVRILRHISLVSFDSFHPSFLKHQAHPGTNVTIIDGYDSLASLRPMREQAGVIATKIIAIMRDHPEGVHLLGFSQGKQVHQRRTVLFI